MSTKGKLVRWANGIWEVIDKEFFFKGRYRKSSDTCVPSQINTSTGSITSQTTLNIEANEALKAEMDKTCEAEEVVYVVNSTIEVDVRYIPINIIITAQGAQ